jgi:hypothetical protein
VVRLAFFNGIQNMYVDRIEKFSVSFAGNRKGKFGNDDRATAESLAGDWNGC